MTNQDDGIGVSSENSVELCQDEPISVENNFDEAQYDMLLCACCTVVNTPIKATSIAGSGNDNLNNNNDVGVIDANAISGFYKYDSTPGISVLEPDESTQLKHKAGSYVELRVPIADTRTVTATDRCSSYEPLSNIHASSGIAKNRQNGSYETLFNGRSHNSVNRTGMSVSYDTLLDTKLPSDLQLHINNGELQFDVHCAVLANKSGLFQAIIRQLTSSNVTSANEKPVLKLKESSDCASVFGQFLYFLYSGAVWLHKDYVLSLSKLACKYNVNALKHHCESYVTEILRNSLSTTEVGPEFSIESLLGIRRNSVFTDETKSLAFQVLCFRVKELVGSPSWLKCSWNLVCYLLKSPHCQAEENILLTAATRWMKKNKLRDKARIEDILTNIRYPLLHRRVLYHLQRNQAFRNFPRIQELTRGAIRYHCFKDLAEARHEFTGIQFQKRVPRNQNIGEVSEPTADDEASPVVKSTAL